VVAHRPLGQQGLTLPNLLTEQVSIHITAMIRFGHQQEDPMGQLLQANVEAFWLEAGLGGQLFHLPPAISEYMMSWFTSTWRQCQLLDIIIMTDIIDIQPQQQYNKEVMCDI